MNLIEQLGGYEKARSIYKNRPQTSTHHFNGRYYENWSIGKWVRFDDDQCVDCKKPDNGSVNLGILGLMLLDYRRQYNIFEVGDDVIFNNTLYKVIDVDDMHVHLDDGAYGFAVYYCDIKHAEGEQLP